MLTLPTIHVIFAIYACVICNLCSRNLRFDPILLRFYFARQNNCKIIWRLRKKVVSLHCKQREAACARDGSCAPVGAQAA
jgi:hypothetical protein